MKMHEKIIILIFKGREHIRKNLGWISVALIIFSFAQMFLLDVSGFLGTIILLVGLAVALVTALFS